MAVRKGQVGFRAEKTHRIEPILRCTVLEPALLQTALALAEISVLDGCELSLSLLDDGVEAVVHGLASPDYGALQDLADIADQLDLARLSYRHRREEPLPIAHRREGLVRFGDVPVVVPAAPFLQATRQGEAYLRDRVEEWLTSADRVADLFCGCGAFALPLVTQRPERRVMAIDRDGPAISALSQAGRAAGLEGRLVCETGDLSADPLSGSALDGFDGVVFDPPRAGARAQAEALAASTVKDVVAVSCNPSSFARDAAILLAG
ncbi:MAG: methyltransferase, partial [Pseudomonadota bacterium]